MKKLTLTLASVLALAVFAMPALADQATPAAEEVAPVLEEEAIQAEEAPAAGQSQEAEVILPAENEKVLLFPNACPGMACNLDGECYGKTYHCTSGWAKFCDGGEGFGGSCQGVCSCEP